jgi:hypothetical protein
MKQSKMNNPPMGQNTALKVEQWPTARLVEYGRKPSPK